jgi:dimethylargininase
MDERVALVRSPSSRMAEGIVTYGDRAPVDAGLAARQHAAYVAAIVAAGWEIREVPHADDLPDSAFVEDTVVVCGDLAVLTRPGADERRAELPGTEEAVRGLGLELARIEEPGTLDGGDVLRVGTTLYAGRGGRTNAEGIRQLGRIVAPRGFAVVPVPLHRVLHLKSAVTALPDGTVIAADPSLIDTSPFPTIRIVPEEAGSHVILLGGGTVLMAASAPRSAELFDDWGFEVVAVDIGEFEKMEGCVTCLSVLIHPGADGAPQPAPGCDEAQRSTPSPAGRR